MTARRRSRGRARTPRWGVPGLRWRRRRPGPARTPGLADLFAGRVLHKTEQLLPLLNRLERELEAEEDRKKLELAYKVDHLAAQIRRLIREQRVLAGVVDDELGGETSSLLEVIRAAGSGIENYTRLDIGRVVDMAVVAYASDDVASLVGALLDNATRFSPSEVRVNARLASDGSVILRIEDDGIGIPQQHLAVLNQTLAGPVPPPDDRIGRHTGFPVVHRVAAKHDINVRLMCHPRREGTFGATLTLVTIPPLLLCDIPQTAVAAAPSTVAASRPSFGAAAEHGTPGGPDGPPAARTPIEAGVTANGLPVRVRRSTAGNSRRAHHVPGTRSPHDRAAGDRAFADDLADLGDITDHPPTSGGPNQGKQE
jgi:hypothetical protein